MASRTAEQVIACLGWESEIPTGYLQTVSDGELKRCLVILAEPDDTERIRQLSRYAEREILAELARREATGDDDAE